jgi:hypothetical protein
VTSPTDRERAERVAGDTIRRWRNDEPHGYLPDYIADAILAERADARRAALEEAATVALSYAPSMDGPSTFKAAAKLVEFIAGKLRALATTKEGASS